MMAGTAEPGLQLNPARLAVLQCPMLCFQVAWEGNEQAGFRTQTDAALT